MNDRTAESSVATGLRITFAIIGAILIMIFTTCLALRLTILNDHFWFDFVKSDEFKELAREEMGLDMGTIAARNGSDVRIDFSDDDAADEFFDIVFDDIIDFMLEGDTEVDETKYEDFFDEYEDELFGDQTLTSAQKREEVQGFIDDLQDMFDNYEDEEFFSALEAYNEAARKVLIATIVTGVIIAVMFVVLIVIHKNKFRPVRAMGIATASAGFLNTLGALFMLAALKVAIEETSNGEEVVEIFIDRLADYSMSFVLVMLATLAVGVAMIVIGCVGASNYNKRMLEE
ncbi:MAG: hypothetical protein J6L84_02630 [Clostridiales bacterium]|nr:hypothetical protein [Clostridiales bacterium]MBP3809779.1 hypothetical protein [Clostridiales bacterium]